MTSFSVRGPATCPFCGGGYTASNPPMHYGKVTVEGRLTSDIYEGVAHHGCIEQTNPATPGLPEGVQKGGEVSPPMIPPLLPRTVLLSEVLRLRHALEVCATACCLPYYARSVLEPRCGALQPDPEGVLPPHACARPAGHDGLHSVEAKP